MFRCISIPLRYNLEATLSINANISLDISIPLRYNLEMSLVVDIIIALVFQFH